MPYRQNFPIPSVIDPPRTCLCLEIPDNDDWRRVVAGLIRELTQWFNYERTGDDSGARCADVWKDIYQKIDWGRMSCCCGEFDVIFQWTEDGVLQSSTDGGETWTDDPQDDPRNSSPIYPPVTGDPSDEKKCIAATSVRDLIKEQVGDQLTDDMSRYTLNQLIHDWVTTYIQTSNPFQALINIITNQVLALVIATLRPALTDDVYNKLMCCVLLHMNDDLSFDDAGWDAVRNCISTDITGIAGVFLEHLIFLIGKVGLTNLARSQAATVGDCSSCFSTCSDNFHINSGVGVEVARNEDYIEVEAVFYAPYGFYTASIRTDDISTCCYVAELDILTEGVTVADNHWFECGSAVEHSGAPDITGHCVSLWTVILSGPGTVRMHLGDCP